MITLTPGHLTLPQLRQIARESVQLKLDPASFAKIDAGAKAVADIAAKGEPAYGINTGFGRLASTHIPHDQLELLQKNLVLSHAVGVGEPMARSSVRLLMALKLSSLGRGHSGIRREVMDALITLFNADVLPLIPVKGSVGASGDLAPLAHMSAVLLGVGEVFIRGERASALDGLRVAGLAPLTLQAKEGLALLNGTQASTALALDNMFAIEDLYRTALVAGALSVDAAAGSVKPFDARIHELRGHQGQIDAAASYRDLLEGSPINQSHRDCDKVQDPYSLRCQPQVMGACLDQMRHAADVLLVEANAVSDNPLIFPDTGEVLSGGNFHAEPVAFGGVNSGFMIAHVTAAALASENKTLAHPASVDSLPTSANQEDHVSMATFAARKLADIADNTKHILAIELRAAAQGVDLRAPYHTSPKLAPVMETIRSKVAHYELAHYFAPDIAVIAKLVGERAFAKVAPFSFASEQ